MIYNARIKTTRPNNANGGVNSPREAWARSDRGKTKTKADDASEPHLRGHGRDGVAVLAGEPKVAYLQVAAVVK